MTPGDQSVGRGCGRHVPGIGFHEGPPFAGSEELGPRGGVLGPDGMSSGGLYTGSVFFVAITREFGWDYGSTAGIFSVFTVLYGGWGILVGHLVDRFGPRRVVLWGGVLLPLALVGNGSAHALWHL